MSMTKVGRANREKFILKLLRKKPSISRKEVSDRCRAKFGYGVRWDTLFILKQQLDYEAAGVKVAPTAKPVLPTTPEPKTNWRPDRTPPEVEQGRPEFREIPPRSFFSHSARTWVYMKLLIPTSEGFTAVIIDAAGDPEAQADIGTLVDFAADTPVEVLEFEFVYPEET